MSRGNSDLIDLEGVEFHAETEKAILIFDGTTQVWLPKSQVEYDKDQKTVTLPEWLALEKGLI